MLRQIVSPLGALFTLELPDAELMLTEAEEQARLDRIAYMQRIAGGTTETGSEPGESFIATPTDN